jgi:sugar phosphate isomerase/epimerase
MTKPLAVQLYSVRSELQNNFEGVVEDIAHMGYLGVETAGFPGTTPEQAARLFKSLELEVCSAHMGLPLGDQKNEIIDTMRLLGSTHIISGLGPDHFDSLESIHQACDQFNQAAAVAAENGMTFGLHNHWWEFEKVEGRYVYEIMLERLSPEVLFEVDIYWVKTAGIDPSAILEKLGSRVQLLHVKDGPAERDKPMTAAGKGTLEIPAIIKAAGDHPKWLIVELDECKTDMLEAIRDSYQYLISEGLAKGRVE